MRVLVGLVALFLIPCSLEHSRTELLSGAQTAVTQVDPHDVGTKMANELKQGRYDNAVELGLHALRNQPSDEIIYNAIAAVYLAHATKDSGRRNLYVTKAIFYTEKGLALNSKDNDVGAVLLFQHARSFERAGDLAASRHCEYYRRSRELLEDRIPLLKAKEITLEGTTYPLAPLREENEKALVEVESKAAKACK